MVNIRVNDKKNQIKINVSPTSNSVSSTIGNETFYNGLAKEWAISPELVQGEDYSAKYYAGQAKQAEQTATEAISHIGTSVEDAAGYAQSAQSSAEYVVNNAPTVTVEQTATGAIVTATDLQGTTTATILNGAKGDKGDTGEQGIQGIQGEKGDIGFSPTATVSKSGKVSTLTVTDLNGTTTTEILDGADGGYTLPIASSSTLGGIKVGSNLSIDANGVLSASASTTVDQTYNPNSANAQSGVAIAGAKFLQNTANGSGSVTILGTPANGANAVNIGNGAYTAGYAVSIGSSASSNGGYSISIGSGANTYGASSVAIGRSAKTITSAENALALGRQAEANAKGAIQLGKGANATANSMAIGFADIDGNGTSASYSMLDGTTGLIPDARISTNIARTSAIPTESTVSGWGFTKNVGTVTSVNNIQPDTNGNVTISTRNVGEVITSTLPLTDAGLHLLDGTLLQYGIYKEFIDYIADLYAENPTANYFTDETTWQASVTQYGSCGKFVYDSVSKTVRLPKVSDILQSTTDINALGDLIEAGLPNIEGKFNNGRIYTTNDFNGGVVSPFIKAPSSTYEPSLKSSGSQTNIIGFDASLSNSIYGNSTTVQPQTIKAFVYIVVANSTKTSIQVDIDNIATDLNNKAGTDLANVTDTGKILMSEMGMPSGTYIDLSLGASGSTYTAPANGWVYVSMHYSNDANAWIDMFNVTRDFYVRYGKRDNCGGIMPVLKGDSFIARYDGKFLNSSIFRFIYAVGSKSEAK